jgi:hypothetical protein
MSTDERADLLDPDRRKTFDDWKRGKTDDEKADKVATLLHKQFQDNPESIPGQEEREEVDPLFRRDDPAATRAAHQSLRDQLIADFDENRPFRSPELENFNETIRGEANRENAAREAEEREEQQRFNTMTADIRRMVSESGRPEDYNEAILQAGIPKPVPEARRQYGSAEHVNDVMQRYPSPGDKIFRARANGIPEKDRAKYMANTRSNSQLEHSNDWEWKDDDHRDDGHGHELESQKEFFIDKLNDLPRSATRMLPKHFYMPRENYWKSDPNFTNAYDNVKREIKWLRDLKAGEYSREALEVHSQKHIRDMMTNYRRLPPLLRGFKPKGVVGQAPNPADVLREAV